MLSNFTHMFLLTELVSFAAEIYLGNNFSICRILIILATTLIFLEFKKLDNDLFL